MHQGSFTEKSALGKIRQIVCVVPQHPYNNPTGAKSLDTAPYVYRSMVLRCILIDQDQIEMIKALAISIDPTTYYHHNVNQLRNKATKFR